MPGLNGSAAGRSVEAPTDLLPPVEDDGRQLRSVAAVLRRFTAIVAALAAKPCSNSFCGGKSPPWAGPRSRPTQGAWASSKRSLRPAPLRGGGPRDAPRFGGCGAMEHRGSGALGAIGRP